MRTHTTKKTLTRAALAIAAALTLAACGGRHGKPVEVPPDYRGRAAAGDYSWLDGHTVGVVTGTTYDLLLTEGAPGARLVRVDSRADIGTLLVTGKVDAVMEEAYPLRIIERGNPGIRVVADSIAVRPTAAIFYKSRTDLLDEFNAYLAELRQSGALDSIRLAWHNCEGHMPDLPEPPAGAPVIKCCTVAALEPVSYIENGQYVGLAIDIAARFAAARGYRLKMADLNPAAFITAVATGKYDMGVSNCCITEERARQVLFSEPYNSEITALAVRAGGQDNTTAQ